MLVSKRPTQSLVVGGVYIGRVVNIIIRDRGNPGKRVNGK